MAATEQTPLLSKSEEKLTGDQQYNDEGLGSGHHTSCISNVWHKAHKYTDGHFNELLRTGLEPLPLIDIVGNMFIMVLRHYWFSLACSIGSAVVCCHFGSPSWNVIDPLIFKSLFVVIGFALGFRNVQASTRRTQAMCSISNLFSSAWRIIGIFANVDDDKIRKTIKVELYHVIDAIARHMIMISTKVTFTFGLVGLQPSIQFHEEDGFEQSGANLVEDFEAAATCTDANLSPCTQIMQFLFLCEDYINKLEVNTQPKSQKMLRSFWAEKVTFLRSYDDLMHLSIPAVSQRYASLIDFTLFCFGVTLSWGIHASEEEMQGMRKTLHMHSCGWLVMNTVFGILVLQCLNALAVEHEAIVGHNMDDIHMKKLAVLFKTAVEGYEESRIALDPSGKTGLEREKDLCSGNYSDGWNRS